MEYIKSVGVETNIRLNKFKPRSYQLPICDAFENKGFKKILVVLPRRAGKDIVAFNLMIRSAVKRIGIYYYILPNAVQARRVMFDGITIDGQRIIDFIPKELVVKTNIQQMKIELFNGSIIQFCGSDNYDSLRGTNPVGCVFSEYAYQHPNAFPTIRPALLANDGWCIFISTPFGENHFYNLYQVAVQSSDWYVHFMTVKDTGHISLEEIQREIEAGEMSPDMAEQEYNCFPEGTPIITPRGVIDIEKIQINDMVFSHASRMRKVQNVMNRDYIGEMIHIKSYGSPEIISCTPEHPIRVYKYVDQVYEWVKAKDINKEHFLVFPKINISSVCVISKELCMLIAWYITEGSCSKNMVTFSCGTLSEAQRVIEYISSINIKSSLIKNKTVFNVVIYSVNLVDFFKEHCGLKSDSKKIPFSLIMGYESEFFHELMMGDGCLSICQGIEKYAYTTVSKSLAYQVQLLAHSIDMGYTSGISIRSAHKGIIEGRSVNCLQSYQVNIYKEKLLGRRATLPFLMRAKNCVAARVISVNSNHFEGKVYNLSVQYDESYLVAGRSVHNCSFSVGAIGSYYGKYLNNMELNYQITTVSWEPNYPVHTAWDLGVSDSTVILMFQVIGRQVNIIDMYQNSSVGLEHYVNVLQAREYIWGKHIAPHDIQVRDFSAGGITRLAKAAQLGFNFIVAPNISIIDGIESVRTTLPRVYIDNVRCKPLVAALRNYRKEYDSAKKVYNNKPLHDNNSHVADALRYLCVTLPKIQTTSNAEDLDKRYRQVRYGENSSMPNVFRNDLPRY